MAFNLSRIKNRSDVQKNSNRLNYMEDMFGNFFNNIALLNSMSSNYDRYLSPSTDVIENDTEYYLEVELPGVIEDDIDLKIDNNVLTLQGKKENISEHKDKTYHVKERYYGSFHRSISLPANIDEENIKATFKDGVLEIRIPKKEQNKAKKITIQNER